MIKVAVIGPESSGKSTLCEELSNRYRIGFIPEFSREYLENLERPYVQNDLLLMAKQQMAHIREFEKRSAKLLLSDTESLVIKIWSEIKYGLCHPEIQNLFESQDFDIYLLCAPDLIWVQDKFREVPDLSRRYEIFQLFKQELEIRNFKYAVISGSGNERILKATEVIDSILSHKTE